MITLHHLEYSQSFRLLWLLEELGVDYELKLYNRDPKTHLAPPEYKAVSPLGTAPVITHNGLALAETNAAVDYILDLHPNLRLRPEAGAPDRARHLFWFHAGPGSFMPLLLIDMLLRALRARSPFFVRPVIAAAAQQMQAAFLAPRLKALLDKAEADLTVAPWFGGAELTAADIVMSYGMVSAAARGVFEGRPQCQAWVERIKTRPAFQRATEKDGRETMAFAL